MIVATTLSQRYSLDHIKAKPVGDGQYGTARWATPREIQRTYTHVPFQVEEWRRGINRPKVQGLVVGSKGRPPGHWKVHLGKKEILIPIQKIPRPKWLRKREGLWALVDSDDIHCLMIGASGVGKTAFFLYPNLEYACASGMSFLALDTKGDLARNYGTIAQKYYGYQVSVIDLRNPAQSDGNNLLTVINRYMDLAQQDTDDLKARAKAEKYATLSIPVEIRPTTVKMRTSTMRRRESWPRLHSYWRSILLQRKKTHTNADTLYPYLSWCRR